MYYVGIDISKYKHDCFIATETGEVIKNSFSFNNDYQGFNSFLSILKSLDNHHEIRIGLEATGHYGTNLKIFLYDNNYSFMEFNPVFSERFRQVTTLRKTKTDKGNWHNHCCFNCFVIWRFFIILNSIQNVIIRRS